MLLAALALMGLAAAAAYRAYPVFLEKKRALDTDRFFPGITIDGVDVSGLNMEQARQALGAGEAPSGGLRLSVHADGRTWVITGREIPFARDVEGVLRRAFSIGRKGFAWMGENSLTPFETRYQHTVQTKRDGAGFRTAPGYRKADVRSVAAQIAAQVDRAPVNAVVATFDWDSEKITVTDDVPGLLLQQEALYQDIVALLDAGALAGDIAARTETVLPELTSVALKNGFTRLASSTVAAAPDAQGAQAVERLNGRVLLPGETLSFLSLLDGADGQGGGAVPTALFEAAALADLSVLERHPPPGGAVLKKEGLDAWADGERDLVVRNDKAYPVFMVARRYAQGVTLAVYGMRKETGESIRLETAPSRDGGTDAYRVYLRDGQEVRRSLLPSSGGRP